jgi:uncharacterized OB-fold protein
MPYLPKGLPVPVIEDDRLDAPYWQATREHKLNVQRCARCRVFQWGPEWLCHRCQSFDIDWVEVEGKGRIFSWQRVWHPIHPALKDHGPYLIVLVELPHAGSIRMIGNLLGDPRQTVEIGADVEAVFEDHERGDEFYTLVQWKLAGAHRSAR